MKILDRIGSYWLCQLGGWGLVGFSMLFYAFFFLDKSDLTPESFLRITIWALSGIMSTHLFREFIKGTGWLQLPVEKILPRLILSIVLTSLLYSFLVTVIFSFFSLTEKGIGFWRLMIVNTVNAGIFIIPWILIYYIYHYIEKSRRQQLDTLKLEALVKELELKTIKSHINPHFIFNALNSIRALIDEDPLRARTSVTALSNILRSSMQTEKVELVPFEKELNIVKDYLALEHIRFDDRLKVEYEIALETLRQPVPPMMLQTLVENAIKHGIGCKVEGGLIKIISSLQEDCHELIIQNSGTLSVASKDGGFGLSSTRNRLYLLFGESSSFEIHQMNIQMVQAKVRIPLSKERIS
jgi:sensor histidine kinase YesM